jgi:OOP family OmpA-OmpF porin
VRVIFGVDSRAEHCFGARALAAPAQEKANPVCDCVFREFLVGFDWNSAGLSPDARRIIDDAASYYRRQAVKPRRINIGANSDASESKDIAQRRVVAVEDQLISAGVPRQIIAVTAYGDRHPLVPASQDAKDARNRMTAISLD